MTKNTFKLISLGSIAASALFVILNIIIKNKTWYKNEYSCLGACSTFSTLALIFTIGGFVLNIVLSNKARKDPEAEGKGLIKAAIILNLLLFFIWVMNYFGIFLTSAR